MAVLKVRNQANDGWITLGGFPEVDDIGIEYDSRLELKDNVIILAYQTDVDGGTPTTGGWYVRPLNTIVHDPNNWTSITSNRFSLAAGTYIITATAEFYRSRETQIRLRNYTDGVYWYGASCYAASGSYVSVNPDVWGAETIADTKEYQIEYRVGAAYSYGLGYDPGWGMNTFMYVTIWRIKD